MKMKNRTHSQLKAGSSLKKQVWHRLGQIMDPELNIDLVSLGLIYRVDIDENGEISILMTLTTPGCPLAAVFEPMIRSALAGLRFNRRFLDEQKDIKIELTFDPPWTEEMISDSAKAELGWG